jgi:hypothetical protein
MRRENAKLYPAVGAISSPSVIARRASDEAIQLSVSWREGWIASRGLSSGARSRDALARNDGRLRCLKIESVAIERARAKPSRKSL